MNVQELNSPILQKPQFGQMATIVAISDIGLGPKPTPPHGWTPLPLILLGIRTALKGDTHSAAAEMVYGTTLRLAGEFFMFPSTPPAVEPVDYVSKLKTHMQQLRPPPPRPPLRNSRVSKGLSSCTHVFVRHDAVRKPLQPPYDGPYPVVKRSDKHYTIAIGGREDTISLDRLKPAHLDLPEDPHPTLPPISQATPPSGIPQPRVGRHVHWPKRLSSYLS